MRIEGKNAQFVGLSQKLFQNVHLGNLRFGRGEVLALNGFINFMSMDRNMTRSRDSDLYAAGSNIEDGYLDFVSYNKAFIFFSCKDQHPCSHLQGFPALRKWRRASAFQNIRLVLTGIAQ